LYEILKDGRAINTDEVIREIETMNTIELREGVIEYLMSRKRQEDSRPVWTAEEILRQEA
jgi:hypothetical protein